MLEQYPGEVKLVFKNYPLTKHQYAKMAAVAAFAAGRQGQFWEFHDRLFANSNKISDVKIVEIAMGLGLDLDRFSKDMKDLMVVAMINQDIRNGARAGIKGTPTVFINGKVSKARTLEALQAAVESELERVRKEKVVKGNY